MSDCLRAGIPSSYVTSQLHVGQLSLTSFRGRLIEYQLCDPMWHVSSRSGVATLRTAIHLLLVTLIVRGDAEEPTRWSSSTVIKLPLSFSH